MSEYATPWLLGDSKSSELNWDTVDSAWLSFITSAADLASTPHQKRSVQVARTGDRNGE